VAVTVASFKAQYAEFDAADDAMVAAYLADVSLLVPVSVWGELQDQGIKLHLAKRLALSPWGRDMKLTSKDGSTVYDDQLFDLQMIVAGGGRVL
jgi:hypothetical protein